MYPMDQLFLKKVIRFSFPESVCFNLTINSNHPPKPHSNTLFSITSQSKLISLL